MLHFFMCPQAIQTESCSKVFVVVPSGSDTHASCSKCVAAMYIPFGNSVVSWRDVPYIKIGNLGSGGSSNTYLTIATAGSYKGMSFAVKVFDAVDREQWRLNFMREVHFLRGCSHPAIMPVVDEGLYRDRHPFVVMEFLPTTLLRVMKEDALTDMQKVNYTVQLLSALKYLGRLDPPVIHRDIKPSNIFLKSDSCILGDFGLLIPSGESQPTETPTEEESAVKTMSRIRQPVPEMARNYRTPELVADYNGGPRPSPSSDVFQLGLVVAELFTGRNPLVLDEPGKPVQLEPLVAVPSPHWPPVERLLQEMLIIETAQRTSAESLLAKWQAIYLQMLKQRHAEKKAMRMRQPRT